MANRNPKGVELMRNLGHAGGKASGEARRLKAYELDMLKAIIFRTCSWEDFLASTPEQLLARHVFREKRSGGSHDSDWRCPKCKTFNSIKGRVCARCGIPAVRMRITRKPLRERAAEHRTAAIVRKHGL